MADRDPDSIKAEIDEAREQLALTVDSLAARANPRRLAVAASLAGVGLVVIVVTVRRLRQP